MSEQKGYEPSPAEIRDAEASMSEEQSAATVEREDTLYEGKRLQMEGDKTEKTPMEDALIYILAKMPPARPNDWPEDYAEVLDQMGIEGNLQDMFNSLKHLDELGIVEFKGDTPPKMGEDQSDGQQINDSLKHLAELGKIRLSD